MDWLTIIKAKAKRIAICIILFFGGITIMCAVFIVDNIKFNYEIASFFQMRMMT